jgi:hypothetical protein
VDISRTITQDGKRHLTKLQLISWPFFIEGHRRDFSAPFPQSGVKMIRRYTISIFILLPFATLPAKADDWMFRVQTMGRICHVQIKTASPLGEDFKGPFPSRKLACQEAANQYNSTLSDQSKCWIYGSGTVTGCKKDGITLPPRSARSKKFRRQS